jgi:hypothetical protein
MGTLLAIIGYLLISVLMLFGLSQGARWIVTPDPTAAVTPTPAARIIPPRIAESIERKKVFVPETPPPTQTKPAMAEASASLSQQPPKVRIREAGASRRAKLRKMQHLPATVSDDRPTFVAPVRGRSDNPYD